ncbi:MAG: hypothetical protein EBZ77_07725, partial [Chitinophagia bacterium]|nr:hypothetical protein [Chitinophagia bacterium]
MFVSQLFEEQASRTAQAVAVRAGNEKITYAELNARAEVLKNAILAHSSNTRIVGIGTHRSIDTIVGLLAILKAGKAYLPLDATLPKPRLEAIVRDCNVDICLTTES